MLLPAINTDYLLEFLKNLLEIPSPTGGDVAVALIGPGVDASHNYERAHMDALAATMQWLLAYLLAECEVPDYEV